MDDFEEIKPDLQEEDEVEALWISEDIRSYLYEASKWTKFLSIVGLVFSIMTAMTAFGAGAVLNSGAISPDNPLAKLGATGLTVIYLVIALFMFYPSLELYRFSVAIKQAVLFADQQSLSAAMRKLKAYFKFWGIITLIFIVLYVVASVMLVVSGTAAAGR